MVHCIYLGITGYGLKINIVFQSTRLVLFLNDADPDEITQYAAFHLGLRCLQKYPFRGFPPTNG